MAEEHISSCHLEIQGCQIDWFAYRGGKAVFVELKSEGKHSTVIQKRQQGVLELLGFAVYADVDTKAMVDKLIGELKDEIQTT